MDFVKNRPWIISAVNFESSKEPFGDEPIGLNHLGPRTTAKREFGQASDLSWELNLQGAY